MGWRLSLCIYGSKRGRPAAQEAAEKGLGKGEFEYGPLQGLKPAVDLIALFGLAEAMPCLQSPSSQAVREFFRSP
jgi:hypothetical protein